MYDKNILAVVTFYTVVFSTKFLLNYCEMYIYCQFHISVKSKYTDNKVKFKTYLFIVGDNTFGEIINIVWRWPSYDFCFVLTSVIIETNVK